MVCASVTGLAKLLVLSRAIGGCGGSSTRAKPAEPPCPIESAIVNRYKLTK